MSKGEKKMEIMTMILGIALFIIGFGLIDYNLENDVKHNIIIGFCGFGITAIGYALIVYRFIF